MLKQNIDPKLGILIACVVILIIVGIYFGAGSCKSTPKPLNPTETNVTLQCINEKCDNQVTMKMSEYDAMPKDANGMATCPKCKKPTLTFTRHGGRG